MATTTELIALGNPQIALLFLVDGWVYGFTNNADLVGFSTGASHDVRLGLQLEGLSVKLAINLRDGQWLDSPAKVTLIDLPGGPDLAVQFRGVADDERSLGDMPFGTGLAVHPLTDLAPRPDLDEHNIGLERIGANGARHQYAVPPGFSIGLEHSITVPGLEVEGAPVTDNPIVWNGRRWALYMVFRDHVTYPDRNAGASSWRPFSEARRLSHGTMRTSGTVSGHEWNLDLEGPDSLLRKPLGIGFATEPSSVIGALTLVTSGEAREDGMYMSLSTLTASYGVRNWVTYITATTTDEMIADITAELNACAAAAGVDGIWQDVDGHHVAMQEDGGFQISIANAVAPFVQRGECAITLHRKVWSALGYDIEAQEAMYPDEDDPRAIHFIATNELDGSPGPDYWQAVFRTGEEGWKNGEDNGGQAREFKPKYLDGTTVLLAGLNEGRGQIIRLDSLGGNTTDTSIAHPGQLAWPVASRDTDPTLAIQIDGVNCNRCGWWLFMGKRRYEGTEEVYDERWWGLANWTNGSAQQDGLISGNSIIVTHWEKPERIGYKTKGGVDSDWIARSESLAEEGQIKAIPIVMLGYHNPSYDEAHIVLQRLLHTTGTCTGWATFEQNEAAQSITGGANEPAGVTDGRLRDAEYASLGLAIPEDWIALPSTWAKAAQNVDNDSILDVKVAFTAGYQAEDVCRSLMAPVGWAWHFRSGRYGIWCPADALTLGDATVVLNGAVRTEPYSQAGRSRLRQADKWQPVDKFKIAADWQPFERKATNVFERQSADPQMRYRPGEATISIMAHGMREGGSGLQERLLHVARWLAMRHFEVQGYPVAMVDPGLDLWPGTVVRITDAELVDPATGYTVTNRLAIVTATNRNWQQDPNDVAGKVFASMTVDLLILGTRTSTPRMNAMIAQAWGYDSATSRIYVKDNWSTVEGDGTWTDAGTFTEPSWSTLGGSAVVEIWQWDGVSWAQTCSTTVSSVNTTTPGSHYVTHSGAMTGTYYRDRDSWLVLRPSTINNAAWVESYFAPISSDAGTWTDDAAAAQPYIPWEQ